MVHIYCRESGFDRVDNRVDKRVDKRVDNRVDNRVEKRVDILLPTHTVGRNEWYQGIQGMP